MKNQPLPSFPTTITLAQVKEFIRQCDLCFYALLPDFHQSTSGKPGFSALLAMARAIDALPLSRDYARDVQRFREALLGLVSEQVQSYYDAYDGIITLSDQELRTKDTHIKRRFNTLMLFEGGQVPEDKTPAYQGLVKDLNAAGFSLDLEYNEQRHQVYGKFSAVETKRLKALLGDYDLEFKASSVSNDFHVSCVSEKYDPAYDESAVQQRVAQVKQQGLSIHFDGMSYMYPDFNSRLKCILRADITVPELADFRAQLGASPIPEGGFHLSLVTEKRAPEPVLQDLIQAHGGRDHLNWSVILSGDMQRKAYMLLHYFGILSDPVPEEVPIRIKLNDKQQQMLQQLSARISTNNTTQEASQANRQARDDVTAFLKDVCPFLPERDIDVRYYLHLQLFLGVLAWSDHDKPRMYRVLTKVRRQLATYEYQNKDQEDHSNQTAHLFDPIRAEILYQWARMRRFGFHLDSEDNSLLSTLEHAIALRGRIDQDPQGCEDHKNALEIWVYRLNGLALLHYLMAEDRYFLQPEALDHKSAKEHIQKAQAIIEQVRVFLSSESLKELIQQHPNLTRSVGLLTQDCDEYEGKLQQLFSLICEHKKHRSVLKKAITSYEKAWELADRHDHKKAGLKKALDQLTALDSSDSESDKDSRALFYHQKLQAYHSTRYQELTTLAEIALKKRRMGFFDKIKGRVAVSRGVFNARGVIDSGASEHLG